MSENSRKKILSISIPSKKRGSHKYYHGSTKTDVAEDVAANAKRPGVRRADLERIAWKHAAGQPSQTKFAEVLQTGMEAVRDNHLKLPDGVSIVPRDSSTQADKADGDTN